MEDTDYELRSLAAVAQASNAMACHFKEFGVEVIDPHFDIPPYLVGFRGTGEREDDMERSGILIEVICADVDRDAGLDAVYALAAMDCLAIAVTFDAHITHAQENPKTGQPWGPHEMQNLCNGEGACDTGLLTDCLITTAVFADGNVAAYNRPYHFHEAAREVAWVGDGENVSSGEDQTLDGYVVDTMRELLQRAQVRNALLMSGEASRLAGLEMPPNATAYRDAVMIRALAEKGGLIRLNAQMATADGERAILQDVVDGFENVSWFS